MEDLMSIPKQDHQASFYDATFLAQDLFGPSDRYEIFQDNFLEFFPTIVSFLEEKYELEISTQRAGYPDC